MVKVGSRTRVRFWGRAALLSLVPLLAWAAPVWAEGGPLLPLTAARSLGLESAAGLRRQPAPVPTSPRILLRRQRSNTISLGLQGQYGLVSGSSSIADGFDHGAGYAVRFRYMLSPRAALGFSFENQRFGSIRPPDPVPEKAPDSHVVIVTVAAEGVVWFHREREITPYLVGGFGYATPDEIDHQIPGGNEPGPRRVNEGPFLVVGGGFERFIRQRFSIDTSLRGFAQIGNSELTTVVELALGIHVYPGD